MFQRTLFFFRFTLEPAPSGLWWLTVEVKGHDGSVYEVDCQILTLHELLSGRYAKWVAPYGC